MASPLYELIRSHQSCVVLTGAGISTESGIPDFRSPTGVWAKYDPMEYATIDAFHRDPVKVWDFYARRLAVLGEAEPNAGHRALARMEAAGLVEAIVTQNVDGLHARAGSRNVIEVHGSIRTATCLRCGTTVPVEEVRRLLESAPAPVCPACAAVVKPDVVMFGELLSADAVARATKLARATDLMLVVGSTLEVYPVAGLPQETLVAGGALAIVNRGPTAYDGRAQLKVDGSAGETLDGVARELGLP